MLQNDCRPNEAIHVEISKLLLWIRVCRWINPQSETEREADRHLQRQRRGKRDRCLARNQTSEWHPRTTHSCPIVKCSYPVSATFGDDTELMHDADWTRP